MRYTLALLTLFLVLLPTSTTYAALWFELSTDDYHHQPGTTKEASAMDALSRIGTQNCLVMELGHHTHDKAKATKKSSDALSGFIRFTAESNLTTNCAARSPIIATVHAPRRSQRELADMTSADALSASYEFTCEDLTSPLSTSSGVTFTVHPQEAWYGPRNMKIVEGNYAVCFWLFRASPRAAAEKVRVHLMEVLTPYQQIHRLPSTSEAENQYGAIDLDPSAEPLPSIVTNAELGRKYMSVYRLQEMLTVILRNTDNLLTSHEAMRATTESTFTRIWAMTLVLFACIAGMVWYTFAYTKNLLIKRKLI